MVAYRNRLRAFTLIEVMVVAAIISLLIGILVPSLSRSRAESRMVACQSNVGQLAKAFIVYSSEHLGQLPGSVSDPFADWLGGRNRFEPAGDPKGRAVGRQPEDGTIYRQMGRLKQAYTCPDDDAERPNRAPNEWYYSYTASLLLTGARTESLMRSHHRANDFALSDHTSGMKPFEGVPMIIEEDTEYHLVTEDDGGWSFGDQLTDRHLKYGADKGKANLGFTDTHVAAVSLPRGNPKSPKADVFAASWHCVQVSGGKWVTGQLAAGAKYGQIAIAPPAYDPPPQWYTPVKAIKHPDDP